MTRITLRAAVLSALLAAATFSSAQAQNNTQPPAPFPAQGTPAADGTVPVPRGPAAPVVAQPALAPVAPVLGRVAPGYPYLNAPLYTCPRQDVPYQVGGTVITNQALSPHEMLYAHEYKAMYPPFYYRSHGGYILTPFGIRSHEHWSLQGTVVKVKYRSKYKLFSGFHPPVVR
jgi:hypothetical protein